MLEPLRKYRPALLAACLVLAVLLFFSANLRQKERTTLFERTVLLVTTPFLEGFDAVLTGLGDAWLHYFWLIDTQRQNELLIAQNRQLQRQVRELEEVRLANERLRELLDFRQGLSLRALPAEVIAEDASSWFRTVVIDKGLDDGVREGLPVVVAEGVVGRIIRSAARQSRVLLVTDASSAVASLVQRNRSRGISRGKGEVLTFEFALREEDIEVGDVVVSSGMGGVFPKGLTIGTVDRVVRQEYGLFQTVSLLPAVDFSRLEEVLVLLRDAP